MRKLLFIACVSVLMFSSCKKKFCGVIMAISTESSPADGEPLYKIYLESGEVVPMKSRGNYQIGEGYCND
ncbi:hypothetical protein [Pedobacter jejuensis]|nr:hypothetical protein [Pedobacter jejuensis]